MQPADKKLATPKEAFRRLYYGLRHFPTLQKALRNQTLSKDFKERIMLAVTEVNGCAICSYAHTAMALESGMSQQEIDAMLANIMDDVPPEQREGVLFAQYVADNRGIITRGAWNKIAQAYGPQKANAILAAVYVIMLGNTYGIPFGSLMARITKNKKYQKDARSSIGYELGMLALLIVTFPFALLPALISMLLAVTVKKFRAQQA